MILHWSVLALLLLPHQIKSDDGAKVHGINDEDFDKEACPNPEERDCKEGKNGKCTRYCFAVRNCGDENRDITRLLLTKAALLIVNKEGRIEEKYVNRHIAKYSRDYLAKHGKVYNILFRFEFKCGVEEAKKEIEKVTDVILYIGSDYANHYNPPTYGFDPTYLQLKNGGELKNGNRPLEFIRQDGNFFIYLHPSEKKSTRTYISTPGIYRVKRQAEETQHLSQLYYDPLRPDNNYSRERCKLNKRE